MRSRMVAFCLGVAAAMLQPTLLPVYLYWLLTVMMAWLCYSYAGNEKGHKQQNRYRQNLVQMLMFFALGLGYSSSFAVWQLSERLPETLVRSDWRVVGIIEDLLEVSEERVRFNLQIKQAQLIAQPSQSKPYPLVHTKVAPQLSLPKMDRIRLSWYHPDRPLHSGMLIEAEVRLKPPHGLVNPAGFDYERWLFSRDIDATGYVRQMYKSEPPAGFSVGEIRTRINQLITQYFPESQHQSLLQALVTGNKQGLSQTQWQQLRRSGTVHLAVISGLHIGFMALLGWWLGRLLTLLVAESAVRILPYLSALLLAGIYALVAGAELPVQRAYLMLVVLMLSGLFLNASNLWNRWLLALTVVLLFSPHAVLETGLWLSFTAVAALIWLAQRRWRWRDALKLQLMLSLAMLPLYLHFFAAVSVTAPVVNLIAIPLITLLVMITFPTLCLISLGAEVLYQPLILLMSGLMDLFWWLAEQGNQAEWTYIEIDGLSIGQLLFAGLAVMFLLLPATFCPRWVACLGFMPLLFATNRPLSSNTEAELNAWVFDVGQGLAVLVKVGEYRLLYDTGAAYRTGGSAAEWAIIPYLKQTGIQHIDRLILSHDDIDHVGGYPALQQVVKFGDVMTSYNADFQHQRCQAGQIWHQQDVTFEILAGGVGDNDNDRSCVLKISHPRCTLLLPGDIGAHMEDKLTITSSVNWLVAAHHGSKHSTSAQFIQRLQPETVIFSAGYANAYNHPHPDVFQRVQQYSRAKILSSASHGAIELQSHPEKGCLAQGLRQEQKRVWRSFNSM